MTPIEQQTCEVEVGGTWRCASLLEARSRYTMARKRCPVCHGQVVVTGSYVAEGAGPAFQHRRKHNGCPQVPSRFRGTSLPHPQALA